MEDKSKYFVVKQKAVPEVLLKVVEAKKLLELEAMPLPTEDYISQILDAKAIKEKKPIRKNFMKNIRKIELKK